MNPLSGSAWYRSAVGWSISLFILVIYLAITFDEFGIDNGMFNYLIPLWLGGGLVLMLIGYLTKSNPIKSVKNYALIVGIFGFTPLSLSLGLFSTGFSLALTPASRSIFLLTLFTVTFAWCAYLLQGYRRRIIERHFMEKEFYVGDNEIVMRLPSKISLDAPVITSEMLWGRMYNKLGPYLFLLVPFAYPLQKLVRDESGFLGGLVLMAVFSGPLMVYLLGRLTCGTYLYVYKVWQLERKYGKPVMFDSND